MSRFGHPTLLVVCVVVLILSVPTEQCPGTTRTWVGGSGQWYDSSNWSPSGNPASSDILFVYSGSAKTSNQNVTTDGGGSITVSGPSANAHFSLSILTIGEIGTGALYISNGGDVTDEGGGIGSSADGEGTVTVTDAGSSWETAGWLYVGLGGTGTLAISNGGYVSNGYYGIIGNSIGSEGTVTVAGNGSLWQVGNRLQVGSAGVGLLEISSGGDVTNDDGYVGYSGVSVGEVTLDGAGSTWTNNGSLYIGGSSTSAGGTGSVTVRNSGQLQVDATLKLWNTGTFNLYSGNAT